MVNIPAVLLGIGFILCAVAFVWLAIQPVSDERNGWMIALGLIAAGTIGARVHKDRRKPTEEGGEKEERGKSTLQQTVAKFNDIIKR